MSFVEPHFYVTLTNNFTGTTLMIPAARKKTCPALIFNCNNHSRTIKSNKFNQTMFKVPIHLRHCLTVIATKNYLCSIEYTIICLRAKIVSYLPIFVVRVCQKYIFITCTKQVAVHKYCNNTKKIAKNQCEFLYQFSVTSIQIYYTV